jgi:hypothetical protein
LLQETTDPVSKIYECSQLGVDSGGPVHIICQENDVTVWRKTQDSATTQFSSSVSLGSVISLHTTRVIKFRGLKCVETNIVSLIRLQAVELSQGRLYLVSHGTLLAVWIE